jgi:hypothetical protein
MGMKRVHQRKSAGSRAALAAWILFLATLPSAASAAVEFNQRIAFVDAFDSCNETIVIDGTEHIVGRFHEDRAGNLHFGFTRNTLGTGIGLTTGEAYLLIDQVTRAELDVAPGEIRTFTDRSRSRLIHLGEGFPGDDAVVEIVTHITINANGEVVVWVEAIDADCR